MKVERVVPVIAITLLLVGTFSTIYVQSYGEKGSSDYLKINGKEFQINEIVKACSEKEIKPEAGGIYKGVLLSDMINFSGVKNPSGYKYKIIGSDGYSKTVGWNSVQNGIFVLEKREVVFSDLPKKFWVKDVIEIKVI